MNGEPVARPRPAANFEELAALLQAKMATFTAAQRALAQRILANPEGMAFMTIGELADAVGLNESTVQRFAVSLGFPGYPALVAVCRAWLREQAQLVGRFEQLASLEDGLGSLQQRAAAFDRANITRTFARVGSDDWDRAVTALSERRTVYVLGLRKCYSAAYLLAYLLGRVRDDVRCLSLGSGTLTDELRRVGPDDCFVGISTHRYTRETVRGLRYAARRGATTIAITDNEASPLSRDAGVTFYVDTTGVSILHSLTAVTSLSQALATDVAARRGKRARSALLFEETLLTDFEVYVAPPDPEPRQPRKGSSNVSSPVVTASPDET